jgi:hypothetical protein
MDLAGFVRAIFSDQVTNLVIALLIAAPIADWLSGSLRAVADGSFTVEAFDVFVRTQVAGRALPLIILLLIGRLVSVAFTGAVPIPGLDLSIFATGGAIAAAVPYLITTLNSLRENLTPGSTNAVPNVGETPPAP